MICGPCGDRRHNECRGGSWCDCQNPAHPVILTNQQRNDLAVYGTTDPGQLAVDAITEPDTHN